MTRAAGTAGGWSRLHPLSPLLRGGRFFLAVLALVTQELVRNDGLRQLGGRDLLLGAAGVLLLGLLVGGVSWWTTRWRLAGAELQIDSGVLRRRNRRVPLARLQSVDVVRSLLARLLGLAELRLEVAGGGRTEAPLAYLGEAEARRLRVRLLASPVAGATAAAHGDAAGSTAVEPSGQAEPGEAVLVRVPTPVLVLSVLLSLPGALAVVAVVAVPVLFAVAPSGAPGAVAALVPVLLGLGRFVYKRVLAEYGFTVAESPDGLRLRHGLLDTRAQTIPLGRVQAIRVHEPLLWRRRGWARVEVDVAGYTRQRGQELSVTSALLPVAPRDLAHRLVERVLGAPLPAADRPVPAAARWRAPLSARRLRLGLDDRHLVTVSGVLTTTTEVLPLAKAQSLRVQQGPWQRRLGLASLHVDCAGREIEQVTARHRAAGEAQALLEDLTVRARQARRR